MNFPVLRLMKADFINYYKMNDDPDRTERFRKLVFQFKFKISTTGSDYDVFLLCYALKGKREVMTPNPKNPITLNKHPKGKIVSLEVPNLGNLELNNGNLRDIIGRPDDLKPFDYLRFEAAINGGYIIYNVYINEEVQLAARAANPCPPAKQD